MGPDPRCRRVFGVLSFTDNTPKEEALFLGAAPQGGLRISRAFTLTTAGLESGTRLRTFCPKGGRSYLSGPGARSTAWNHRRDNRKCGRPFYPPPYRISRYFARDPATLTPDMLSGDRTVPPAPPGCLRIDFLGLRGISIPLGKNNRSWGVLRPPWRGSGGPFSREGIYGLMERGRSS